MRVRPLLVISLLVAACGGEQTATNVKSGGGSSGGSGGAPAASCLSFDPIDLFINMNATAAGTAVTTTNLGASTEIAANDKGWAGVSRSQSFAASQVSIPAAISIRGGSSHGCGYSTGSLAHNAEGNFTVSSLGLPPVQELVIAGWLVNLPPNQANLGDYFDLAQVESKHSYTATIQIDSGNNEPACTAYGIEIESSGGITRHSQCISSVTPGGTYFVEMHVNYTEAGACAGKVAAPCAEMNVYTTAGANFTQVGSTVSVALDATDSADVFNLGNNEGGQFSGTFYFQNWMVDYTAHQFPNLPH